MSFERISMTSPNYTLCGVCVLIPSTDKDPSTDTDPEFDFIIDVQNCLSMSSMTNIRAQPTLRSAASSGRVS